MGELNFNKARDTIEDLLKNQFTLRREASRIIEQTQRYADKGIDAAKNDIIEEAMPGVQRLSADRVQTSTSGDSKVVSLVDRLGKQASYTYEGMMRLRVNAIKEIAQLDALEECVQLLETKQKTIINAMYYCVEVEKKGRVEIYRLPSYETVKSMCGYNSKSSITAYRNKAISNLTRMMLNKKLI